MSDARRSRGWRTLRGLVIALGILLAPAFFTDMLVTVAGLLRPGMGKWAWLVPAATEGSFVFLFLLGLLLLIGGKPMGWLRWPPYLFAALSLVFNVWAGHGDILSMGAHAAITLAFFFPIIAAEQAVRSAAVTDEAVALDREMKAALLHARDLIRAHTGWRTWQAPRLLRVQVRNVRPPARVVTAVKLGVEHWEPVVEDWVLRELTKNRRLAARLAEAEREIDFRPVPEPAQQPDSRPVPEPSPGRSENPAPNRLRKPSQAAVRNMPGADLAPYVEAILGTDPLPSRSAIMREFHVSAGKARDALDALTHEAQVIALGHR